MRKETITYTDYNNVTRTEDFFFNLNEAELTALQYGVDETAGHGIGSYG